MKEKLRKLYMNFFKKVYKCDDITYDGHEYHLTWKIQ